MALYNRFSRLLKYYKKTYVSSYQRFCSFEKYFVEKNDSIDLKKYEGQHLDFHNSAISNCSPSLTFNTLENKILNFCINLRNGRVYLNDIEEIIQIYEKTNNVLLDNIDLILLKCCGELLSGVDLLTRRKLTKKVWNLLERKGCEITLKHYNVLLEVYAQNLEFINPREFLDNMTIEPDQRIYCSLLNVISKTGDSELTVNMIKKMKGGINRWSKETFDVIVKANAMQGNIEEAYKVIEEMKFHEIVPSTETYVYLAYGYARTGVISNVIDIFQEYHPSVTNIIDVIKILIRCGYEEHVDRILKFLPVSLKLNDLSLITNAIIELIYAGKRKNALKMIINLPTESKVMNICVEYVRHFVNEGIQLDKSDEDILKMIHEIIDHKYSPFVINEATEVALSKGRISLALSLFEEMRKNGMPVRSHYYWPLLIEAHGSADRNKFYSLIKHMISSNVEMDKDTLIDYVLPFANLNFVDPIEMTKRLIDNGINYMSVIESVSAFLLRENKLKDLILLQSKFKVKINFCDSYLEKSLVQGYDKATDKLAFTSLMLKILYTMKPPYLYILNGLLNDAAEFKKLQRLIEFLQILKKYKVILPRGEIEVMKKRIVEINLSEMDEWKAIEDLLKDMDYKEIDMSVKGDSSDLILSLNPHPNKMDTEELRNHIIELKSKNLKTRGAIKKLLERYCKCNDLKGAEGIKEEIISNNIDWTPGMRAMLFDLYVKNNLLDKAEVELNEIRNNFNHFMLDNNKILSYAICLVKNNRLDDAFNAINDIKNINASMNVTGKCLRLLSAITNGERHGDAEKMLITLVKNNYCKLENSLLNPLVKSHIERNDIESAVDSFLRCAKKYKQTPAKQILLGILVRHMGDSSIPDIKNKLKKVLNSIRDIHGEPVAVVKLILALAELGEIEQLREIFQMRDVQMKLLINDIRNYDNDSKLNISLTIFEVIKYTKNINVNLLCDYILSIYDQNNDSEGADRLLREMERESIRPTKKYISKFRAAQ
ncbi:leucine-rich PPR motif-containing protein, mitochondrial-like isoform X1 [Vespa velutina]|uniref:leucine-rich PPR motif-containing protein, mitochondrial-like isoform X1 n=2 Tax=Vespa velutina TaxID=202808 RepID=UPI001FB3390F|nr:leucine-rich PPR motif-containing protein, mitochondrial-like isoform X1 [Vespa velutina]